MRKLRSQAEVMSSWKGDLDKPIVSICCVTYNHELYIEDALEGFLIQETEFPFEILIHDDASTDKTAEIIRKYAVTYPNLIKPVLQLTNQFIQARRWFDFLIPMAEGKYIALCEGDDFWNDSRKLQKQYNFLETHPEYVISCHDARVVDTDGHIVKNSKLPIEHKRDFTQDELIKGKAWLLTLSCMYRNVLEQKRIPERYMILNGDKFFTSLIGHYGKSHFHNDIEPATYRVHDGGIWSTLAQEEQNLTLANTMFWLSRYYERIGNPVLSAHFKELNRYFTLRSISFGYIFRFLLKRLRSVLYRIKSSTKN